MQECVFVRKATVLIKKRLHGGSFVGILCRWIASIRLKRLIGVREL